ncbi:MAG: mycothiol synthase [Actinomycetota bacterium]|nr:mycothiol synthase [Actinomycetota bacterium]MEC9467057.1 mycothiol synthase [Actinomycetota bacterium]
MADLTVSDGIDAVTLTGDAERWLVELDLGDLGEPGDPTDELGTPAERGRRMLEAATQAVVLEGGGRLEYWIERVDDQSDETPTRAGFVPWRDLVRLRRELPALPTDLDVRAYTDADADAFLDVNNRAFDWHPEQGDMTQDDLAAKQAEPWYDPQGFLILEEQGTITGFCWTKVHDDESPVLGEIYAIAVDPEHHGRGLGRELTLAGLAHLADRGLRHAILYVESDNRPARRMYRDLGFEVEFTNRAYQRFVR